MSTLNYDNVCPSCIAGVHSSCVSAFRGASDGTFCCCDGEANLRDYLAFKLRQEYEGETPTPSAKKNALFAPAFTADPVLEKTGGESGYIHPDAWASTADIGTLTDPRSTGRKRADRLFPITPGMVCEWARLKNVGGGPKPITGCMGNPASDLHHGPDKNTLNNSKMSEGIGFGENVHRICSFCHNLWHALNDEFYPPYDRVEDQAQPWLPHTDFEWGPQISEAASFDELVAEEQRREEDRLRRGKETHGRNSKPRDDGDRAVADDE